MALRALDAADGHVVVEGLGPEGDLDGEERSFIFLRDVEFEGPGRVAPINTVELPVQDLTASIMGCLLYTSPSPRDMRRSRMPSSA